MGSWFSLCLSYVMFGAEEPSNSEMPMGKKRPVKAPLRTRARTAQQERKWHDPTAKADRGSQDTRTLPARVCDEDRVGSGTLTPASWEQASLPPGAGGARRSWSDTSTQQQRGAPCLLGGVVSRET